MKTQIITAQPPTINLPAKPQSTYLPPNKNAPLVQSVPQQHDIREDASAMPQALSRGTLPETSSLVRQALEMSPSMHPNDLEAGQVHDVQRPRFLSENGRRITSEIFATSLLIIYPFTTLGLIIAGFENHQYHLAIAGGAMFGAALLAVIVGACVKCGPA